MDASAEHAPTVLALGERILPDWLPDADIRFAEGDQGAALIRRLRPAVVMVDIDAWNGGLAESLAEAPHERSVVLIASADEADAAGMLLDQPIDGFLNPADDPFAGRQLLEGLLHRHRPVDSVADVGLGADFSDPLELLRRDAERVARALADLATVRPGDTSQPRPVTAARIRAHIKARRLRDRFFGPDMFADPAWDMLLDLAAARLEQRPVSVSSLCIAAAVPTTTALRWIKTMMDRGHFERNPDPMDARRAFIALSNDTSRAVDACLDGMLNLPGQ